MTVKKTTTIEELKSLISHARECCVSDLRFESFEIKFFEKPKEAVVPLVLSQRKITNSELPLDPTEGTGFTEDELFLSAGGE